LKWYEIGCKLLLITNRQLHRDFQFVPKSVTSNDLEWCNSPYFALFYRIWPDYITVVEDRPISFAAEYSLPVIFWQKLTHAAVIRSLCDS